MYEGVSSYTFVITSFYNNPPVFPSYVGIFTFRHLVSEINGAICSQLTGAGFPYGIQKLGSARIIYVHRPPFVANESDFPDPVNCEQISPLIAENRVSTPLIAEKRGAPLIAGNRFLTPLIATGRPINCGETNQLYANAMY